MNRLKRWLNAATTLGAVMLALGFFGFATNLFAPGKTLLFSVAHAVFIVGVCVTVCAVIFRTVSGVDNPTPDTTVWYEW